MVAAMVTSCLDNRYQVGLSSMCGLLGLWLEACASPGAASDQPGVQDGITTGGYLALGPRFTFRGTVLAYPVCTTRLRIIIFERNVFRTWALIIICNPVNRAKI
jgi:hypothetical protein